LLGNVLKTNRPFAVLLIISGIFSLGAFNYSFILLKASELGVNKNIKPLVYAVIKHIAISDKIVDGKVSSYDIINQDTIGQKGFDKLSFLNLSSIGTVEFYSHSAKVGMKIVITDEVDGLAMEPMNNIDALSHPGG
jgi:hypothetical protein